MSEIKKHLAFYLVIDESWTTGELAQRCRQAVEQGVTCLDILGSDQDRIAAVQQVAIEHGLPCITQFGDGDGAYLPTVDMVADMRQKLGAKAIVGCTVFGAGEAKEAQKAGADYLGVPAQRTGLETLKAICAAVGIPVVAYEPKDIAALHGCGINGVGFLAQAMPADLSSTAAAIAEVL